MGAKRVCVCVCMLGVGEMRVIEKEWERGGSE